VTGVHDDESHSVSALMARISSIRATTTSQALAHALERLRRPDEVVEDHAKFFGRLSDVDEFAQQKQISRELLQESRVFSMSARMSRSRAHLGAAVNAETERESAPLFHRRCRRPRVPPGRERRIRRARSNRLGTRSTAFARQIVQVTSNSADGSVTGSTPDGVSTRCRARNRRVNVSITPPSPRT